MSEYVNVCPFCRTQIMIDATMVGTQVQCPNCHNVFTTMPIKKSNVGLIIGIIAGVVVGGFLLLAILAAMLLPALNKAREKAREISCANNQKMLALSLCMYEQDYDNMLLDVSGYSAIDHFQKLIDLGYVYVADTQKVFLCPSDEKSMENSYHYVYYGELKKLSAPAPMTMDNSSHNGRYNVAWTDGHVEPMTESQLNSELNSAIGISLPISRPKKGKNNYEFFPNE